MNYNLGKRTRTLRIFLNDLGYQIWNDLTKASVCFVKFADKQRKKSLEKRTGVLRETLIDCSDTIRTDVKKICDEIGL